MLINYIKTLIKKWLLHFSVLKENSVKDPDLSLYISNIWIFQKYAFIQILFFMASLVSHIFISTSSWNTSCDSFHEIGTQSWESELDHQLIWWFNKHQDIDGVTFIYDSCWFAVCFSTVISLIGILRAEEWLASIFLIEKGIKAKIWFTLCESVIAWILRLYIKISDYSDHPLW